MSALALRADARRLPLPDASVDLVVTSPPYFGLRSYTDNGEHYDGQIGSEATPAEWLASLVECTREWVRVLKPSGSIFVNLGDKYGGNQPAKGARIQKPWQQPHDQVRRPTTPPSRTGHPPKSLLGLPWRYALACTDELGLILRRDIIWAKPNGLPESVTDRCRSSHEYVFHLVKQPRYYAAVDEIREPHGPQPPYTRPTANRGNAVPRSDGENRSAHLTHDGWVARQYNPLGKLPGSVWSMPERETLVRSVLRAVSAGHLTIDEAERLITGGSAWTGSSGSTPGSSAPMGAGTGSAPSTMKATGITAAPATASEQSTASPMNSGSDLSQPGSPSTTSAATGDASTPPTSKPSPSVRTSGEVPEQPRPAASMGTSSTPPTLTAGPTENESAGPACGSESAITTHGGVWSIPSQPLTVPAHLGVDHFAAFPLELPRRIIAGWSPLGICTACGEGRRPVVDRAAIPHWKGGSIGTDALHGDVNGMKFGNGAARFNYETTVTGYACACTPYTDHPERRGKDFHAGTDRAQQGMNDRNGGERYRRYMDELANPRGTVREYHFDAWTAAPTTPAVVLDPFAGTGTTMLAASALGRVGIGCDLSMDYARLARWRTQDRAEIAKAMQVPKPPPVIDGQDALFAL